jgi:DNA-directed RNA polymerase specialized sigma24 family protein
MNVGAPNVSEIPAALTIRDLRRNRSLAPGGPLFDEVARRFLPLVYGIGAALVPENPEAAESICRAVFETLAFRWRRISRKIPVASWLVRTTWYVAVRERKRLRLTLAPVSAALAQTVFKRVNGLSRKQAEAFVLCAILGEFPDAVARALGTTTARVEKRHTKSVAKVTRAVHKRLRKLEKNGPVTAPAFRSYVVTPPIEMEERVLARVTQWTRKTKKDSLVINAISQWQWLRVRTFFKRLLATVGAIVCVLMMLSVTVKVLSDRGYINLMLIFMSQMSRDVAKEFPDMLVPARPWPTKPQEMALASTRGPHSSAELYGLTNIWLAKCEIKINAGAMEAGPTQVSAARAANRRQNAAAQPKCQPQRFGWRAGHRFSMVGRRI